MVNPRVGQVVYYKFDEERYYPMMVVRVLEDRIEGYVFLPTEKDNVPHIVYTSARMGGRAFPAEGNIVPGSWFYPFPEL